MTWKPPDNLELPSAGKLRANAFADLRKVRLVRGAGRKVYLILDSLRVHYSKPVKAWLAEHTLHGRDAVHPTTGAALRAV